MTSKERRTKKRRLWDVYRATIARANDAGSIAGYDYFMSLANRTLKAYFALDSVMTID